MEKTMELIHYLGSVMQGGYYGPGFTCNPGRLGCIGMI